LVIAEQAETVARSISQPSEQTPLLADIDMALMDVDKAVPIARDSQRIVNIADQRLIVIRPFSDVDEQAQALVAVAQVVAEAGHPDQALAIARSIPDPNRQAQALVAVAKVVAAGDSQRAVDIARSIPDLDVQALALAGVAGVIAAAGDQERAVSIAEQLE